MPLTLSAICKAGSLGSRRDECFIIRILCLAYFMCNNDLESIIIRLKFF